MDYDDHFQQRIKINLLLIMIFKVRNITNLMVLYGNFAINRNEDNDM